jgi:hypothetical protein
MILTLAFRGWDQRSPQRTVLETDWREARLGSVYLLHEG